MCKQLNSIIKSIRKLVVDMSYEEQLSHVSSALSMVDYLTVLFYKYLELGKDKIVVGKPFGGQTYHVIFLYLVPGYKIVEENKMIVNNLNPLVSYSEDILSNSLSAACGIALTTKEKVFVNISDAQLQSGFFWEGCMFAGNKNLKNITLAVDYNNMQCLGTVDSVMSLEPLKNKFDSFKWDAYICDAYNVEEMVKTFDIAFSSDREKPVALIMLTQKGYGIETMANMCSSHGKTLTTEEYRRYCEKDV